MRSPYFLYTLKRYYQYYLMDGVKMLISELMVVTVTALWEHSFFLDTDLHGSTQIKDLNNIPNIFNLRYSITNLQCHLIQPPEVST